MMYKNFDDDTLDISLSRIKDGGSLVLTISSDYSGSERKQRLHVDQKKLAQQVEDTWKAIKTKMLLNASVSFGEIDWYDDHTDMYDTPVVSIERGLRKAKIGYAEHGSIPKEWSIEWRCRIKNTNTMLPIIDVVKNVLSTKFDKAFEDRFKKMVRPVLQGKKPSISVPKILRA